MRNLSLLAGMTAVLLLGACGGDDKTGPGGGNDQPGETSFSATVSGDVEESLAGTAYYGDDDNTTGGGFALALGSLDVGDDQKGWVVFAREQSGKLGNGTYDLFDNTGEGDAGESDIVALAMLGMDTEDAQLCASTGGELEVTSSSGEKLEGTFTVTMVCTEFGDASGEPTGEVTITGEYDAEKAVIPVPNL